MIEETNQQENVKQCPPKLRGYEILLDDNPDLNSTEPLGKHRFYHYDILNVFNNLVLIRYPAVSENPGTNTEESPCVQRLHSKA